jgi:photosystem II stability/assembly factor-like uncharacterized protein
MRTSLLTGCLALLALASAPGGSATVSVSSPARFRLAPNAIAFWDRGHGVIGSGFRYCNVGRCAGGAISLTDDGGGTSRVVLRTRRPVTWVTVAKPRQAWAVAGGELLHTEDGGRTWAAIAGAFASPSFADRLHGLACGGGCPDTHAPVATDDGGRHWHRVIAACAGHAAWRVQGVALVTPTHGWALCVGEGGAGNEGKALSETRNGGRTWTRLLGVEIGGASRGGVSSYGYPLGIAFAANGVGLMWESRGTLYQTRDGGRRWTPLASVARPEVDFGLSASVVPGRAFALLTRGSSVFRLVATTRGYSGWRTVRVWHLQLAR